MRERETDLAMEGGSGKEMTFLGELLQIRGNKQEKETSTES